MIRTCLILCLLASGTGLAQGTTGYAFFTQSTVASHKDGFNHGLPSMARLEDGRILVTWSRYAPGSSDFAVVGAFSSDSGCTWTAPRVLIDHLVLLDADPSVVVSGKRVLVTCTTVSFAEGIRESATWCIRSDDNGHTWSDPFEIPMNHRYTCGKCHRGLRLKSGVLLLGYSWDVLCEEGKTHQGEGEMALRAGVMRSLDNGDSWTNGGDTHAQYERVSAGAVRGTDEPALVELEDGSVYMLMRVGGDHLYEARSTDEGQTWTGIGPSPLTGSNAPAALARFDTADGRNGVMVVWDNALTRYPLCAAASFDGCRTWSAPKDIGFPYTGGQASYPSCVQAADGALLAVWQQDVPGGRDVRMARFSPAWLVQESDANTLPTIVLFGDSTTAPRGPLRGFGTLLQEDLPGRGVPVNVVNAGVGSNTTAMARARFESDVLARNPAVVTLWFGINDAAVDVWKGQTAPRVPIEQFRENLTYFVKALRAKGTKPILMTANPLAWTDELRSLYGKPPYKPEDPEGLDVVLQEYVEAVRELATSEDVPLVDVYRIFQEQATAHPAQPLLLDGMHPNDWGHRLIADALLPIIPRLLETN